MDGLLVETEDKKMWLVINGTGDKLEVEEKYEDALQQAKNWNDNSSGFFTRTIRPGLLRFGTEGEN